MKTSTNCGEFSKVKRAKKIGAKRTARRRTTRRLKYLRWKEANGCLEIRKKQVRRKIGNQWQEMCMPPVLCLVDARNETLAFFSKVEAIFDDPTTRGVSIDHTTLEHIGIEAALLLTAQFFRFTTYAPKILLRGRLNGMPESVQGVLEGIGYLQFYPLRKLPSTLETDTRYIRIKTGRGSDAQASGEMVEAFRDENFLDTQTASRLGKCLVECLDNVSQHAYAGHCKKPLRKRWWLVGYCDRITSELYFAILDLGIGMPRSLEKRKREMDSGMKSFLFGLSDEELIVTAFLRGFSSTKKKNRGFGLPALKKIIDKFGRGQLKVFSHFTECRLEPKSHPKGFTHKVPLEGTMLTWKLRPQMLPAPVSEIDPSNTFTFQQNSN